VIPRRAFFLTPLLLRAQPRHADLVWVWLKGRELPAGVAESSIVLSRHYAADPRPAQALKAIWTGKFPHAVRQDDASLASVLQDFGYTHMPGTPAQAVELLKGARTGPLFLEVQEEAGMAQLLDAASGAMMVFTRQASGKVSFREEAVHHPLALRQPGVLSPKASTSTLFSQVDLMPTILWLLNLRPALETQGRNLGPVLQGTVADVPDSVFIEGPNFRSVVRGYDKLVADLSGAPLHLYHLLEDPLEELDVMEDPKARLIRDAMLALAQVWIKRIGDRIDPSGLKER
jgi:hypothetical protein